MALVRFEPTSFQTEVNRLFSSFFDTPTTAAANGALRRWTPAMDVVEDADHYVLRADLPGMDESDVRIEVEHDVLTVAGERKAEHASRKDGYMRVERSFGSFHRSMKLPEGVDADAITAAFDKGVLEVRVPKPEQRKPRRVAIQVGTQSGDDRMIEGGSSD